MTIHRSPLRAVLRSGAELLVIIVMPALCRHPPCRTHRDCRRAARWTPEQVRGDRGADEAAHHADSALHMTIHQPSSPGESRGPASFSREGRGTGSSPGDGRVGVRSAPPDRRPPPRTSSNVGFVLVHPDRCSRARTRNARPLADRLTRGAAQARARCAIGANRRFCVALMSRRRRANAARVSRPRRVVSPSRRIAGAICGKTARRSPHSPLRGPAATARRCFTLPLAQFSCNTVACTV